VSNLGRFLRGQQDHFAEGVLWLDGRLGGLGLGHDQVWGDTAKACFWSWSSMDDVSLSAISQLSLSVTVKGPLDVSPDGDDTARS
jgi:hypothetical protein